VDSSKIELNKRIILLDGECVLCNRFASFIHPRLIENANLQFFGIESETGMRLISQMPESLQRMDTVYLLIEGVPFTRSMAIIKCLQLMKFPYKLIGLVFSFVPTRLRDSVYGLVAKKRRSIFGTTDTCVFIPFNEQVGT